MYSKQRLLKILKDYAKEIGRSPRKKDVDKNSTLPSVDAFLYRFGTWNNVLKKAGLKINAVGVYSKKELIDALRQFYIK